MVKETRNDSEDRPNESSILQNPAVIFERIDFLISRFHRTDYLAGEIVLTEWLNEQWWQVYEALDIVEIGQKVNDFVTYSGKVVYAGSHPITIFSLHGEFEEQKIDLEFITAAPFGNMELQEVIAKRISKDAVPEQAFNTVRELEVARSVRIKCSIRPLEIETEDRERMGRIYPKVGNVIQVGSVPSKA